MELYDAIEKVEQLRRDNDVINITQYVTLHIIEQKNGNFVIKTEMPIMCEKENMNVIKSISITYEDSYLITSIQQIINDLEEVLKSGKKKAIVKTFNPEGTDVLLEY